MRSTSFVFLALLFTTFSAFAQTQYEVSADNNGGKILKGVISRDVLEKDPVFSWYAENEKKYTPNASGLQSMKKNADSVQLVVFMGTWCEDSHYIVPKLFIFLDAAGFPADRVSLIAVDRSKKTVSHLTEALGITNVPTIIALKNGKELGRVVEYGKYGLFDKELGEIIAPKD